MLLGLCLTCKDWTVFQQRVKMRHIAVLSLQHLTQRYSQYQPLSVIYCISLCRLCSFRFVSMWEDVYQLTKCHSQRGVVASLK